MEFEFYVHAAALSRAFYQYPAIAASLCDSLGGVEEVFDCGDKVLGEMMPHAVAQVESLFSRETLEWARGEMQWCRDAGVRPLCREEKEYPARLRECPDAPAMIYVFGQADLNAVRMLSVVGTRRATYYGKSTCNAIVSGLRSTCGETSVVSGLAFGIDAASHNAALDAGLPTIAVLPTGLDTIYPSSHRSLAARIVSQGGALVTEFPRGSMPQAYQFLRRNRIIAGMSDGCILGESFAKGGGLITAHLADSYGREVMAVPGRATDLSFEGCNNLIASNVAHLVTGPEGVAEVMGWSIAVKKQRAKSDPVLEFEENDPCRKAVLQTIVKYGSASPEKITDELLGGASGSVFKEPEIVVALTSLELDGKIMLNGNRLYEAT